MDMNETLPKLPEPLNQSILQITEQQKREKRNRQRRAREQALRDLGLVKVRGALGGTYWE